MATIKQNAEADLLVRPNFTMKELRANPLWGPPDEWELSARTLDLLQYIRDYFGVPIRVTSTLRTKAQNTAIKGSSTSLHLTGRAIDFQFADANGNVDLDMTRTIIRRLRRGAACMGQDPDGIFWTQMYTILGQRGGGFGWYGTKEDAPFIHIDDRGEVGDLTTMWDLTNGFYDNYEMTTEWFANSVNFPTDCNRPQNVKKKGPIRRLFEMLFSGKAKFGEDGVLGYWNTLVLWGSIFTASTLGLTWYYLKKNKK